jgi:hypothetical protein
MAKTRRVVLIHWNEAEAAQRLRATRVRGFRLEHQAPRSGEDWARFRADLPAAVVIDLSRLPSHGREVALGLRGTKATRSMPIVFVGGAPEKVAAVRAKVVDAPFCDWDGLAPALVKAIAAPPVPVPRQDAPATGYSGTPLAKKLGIADGMRVLVVNAPEEFRAWLEPIPEGVEFVRDRGRGGFPIVWVFTTARKELMQRLPLLLGSLADRGHLWVSWPKKSSGISGDMSEDAIRDSALTMGLVDTKVCSVNAIWSGLRLNRRVK